MKTIIVMSDNHGSSNMVDEIKNNHNADYYIHCGDSEMDTDLLDGWILVRGNNDWLLDAPKDTIVQIEGLRFFVCHGDGIGYFNREEYMLQVLRENDCQVMLSGHTHMPMHKEIDGHTLINPGSTNYPRGGFKASCCKIVVDDKKIDVEFIDV